MISKNNLYKFYLACFFIILALPILELPPYFFPPDWGKTITFKIIFSAVLFVFLWQILWSQSKRGKKSSDESASVFDNVKKVNFNNISFWLLILLFSVYFLATLFSTDINFSLWGSPLRGGGFVNYGFYILFAAILFLTVKERGWRKLWDFSFVIGILVSIVALISRLGLLGGIFLKQTDQITSTIGGPTILGLYLLLLAFPALGFASKETQKFKKIFYFASFLLFCLIIILTISQGAYLGLALGFLYFLFFYPKKILFVKLGLLAVIVISLAGVFLIESNPQNQINNNYLFSTLTKWSLDKSRVSAWTVATQAFLHRPILGYGPENFSTGFDKYYDPSLPLIQRDPAQSSSWWDRPHNFIFNILSDAGILGLVSFILLFGFIFFQLYKTDPSNKIISHGLQATLLAYFADLFFNFDSFSSFLMIFFVVGYSMSLIIKRADQSNSPAQFSGKKGVPNFFFRNKKPITALMALFLIYFIWFFNIKPMAVNAQINKAQYYAGNKDCDLAFSTMDQLVSQHTILDGYVRLEYVDFLKTCSEYHPDQDLNYAKKGVQLLKENIKIMPNYTRNWLFLGAFENILIATEQNPDTKTALADEAQTYFKKANELSPKRQEVFVEWIKKDLVSGDYQGALEKSNICISLNQGLPDCYWFKGVAEIYFNNKSSAQNDFQTAQDKGWGGDAKTITSLSQLADAYAFIKDYQDLADTYQKLINLNGDVPQYHSSLAFTYKELGQYQKARDEAMIFLKLMPSAKDEVDAFLRTLP